MTTQMSSIVNVNTVVQGVGTGFASFGIMALFAPESEVSPVLTEVDAASAEQTDDSDDSNYPDGQSAETADTDEAVTVEATPKIPPSTWYTFAKGDDYSACFAEATQTHKALKTWFANCDLSIKVYIVPSDSTTYAELSNSRAMAGGWFYHFAVTKTDQINVTPISVGGSPTTQAMREWADANTAFFWHTVPTHGSADATAIIDAIKDKSVRRACALYRDDVATDERYYDCIAAAANRAQAQYQGLMVASNLVFKSALSIHADDLSTEAQKFANDNKLLQYVVVEEANVRDNGEFLNPRTYSGDSESVDAVIAVDVISSMLRVAAYTYLRREQLAALDRFGQAQIIGEIEAQLVSLFDAGVLAQGNIENPLTREDEFCQRGFKIYTVAEDFDKRDVDMVANNQWHPISLRYRLRLSGESIVINQTIVRG